ncbi:MAG: transporter related protein [Acidimicrobiales bacterium]|nr:transporter related protein [Acidimicrobiales bacterium]
MHSLLPFLITGITIGAVYGLAATGLVLTYKTSGIFNFAHGSVASLAVFAFYELRIKQGLPWPLAAFIAVFVLGPIGGLLLERMARLLADVGHVLKITATVGLILVVIAFGNIYYGDVTELFPTYLPIKTVKFAGVFIGYDQIIIFVIAVTCTTALAIFFKRAPLGVKMRGVVDDAALLSMTGTSPARVRQYAWMIGSTFACLSGVLLAPTLNINGTVLTLLVVQAFGAAAIGFFSSLPRTFVGGLIIGVGGALATKYSINYSILADLPIGLPFLILFVVLIFTPRSKLIDRRFSAPRSLTPEWHAPNRVRMLVGVAAVVVLGFVPQFASNKLPIYTIGVITMILFLSLGVLVRASGQVSLCQYGFAAVGAAAMAHFSQGAHLPWLLALVLAALVMIPVGALVAIPAVRLSGVFLALATFGFGVLLQSVFYGRKFMFGSGFNGLPARRPHMSVFGLDLNSDNGFYYVCLAVAVVLAVVVVLLLNGRLGRLLRALSDSPVALETYGSAVTVLRVLTFCLSAMLAGIAGALTVSLYSFGTGSTFPAFNSLTLVALITIIPIGLPWYAVVGAASMTIVPSYISGGNVTHYLNLLFGLSAILAPLTIGRHKGAPEPIRRLAARLDQLLPGRRMAPALAGAGAIDVHAATGRGELGTDRSGLEVHGLRVQYGGAVAVTSLDLVAPRGAITGLIGPNGAGKTTTFNVCSGLVRPTAGAVILHGNDISGQGVATRARDGIGRTFQRVELFESLSVRENIALGREAGMAGNSVVRQIVARAHERRTVDEAVTVAAELTGITGLLDVRARDLSTGQRRLLELARALAGPFDMLLLDEPSSGLDHSETRRFGEILQRAVEQLDVGVLIVEHDMALVQQICNHVYVLDFGQLIFEGSTPEMLASDVVRAAYLGTDSAALPPPVELDDVPDAPLTVGVPTDG